MNVSDYKDLYASEAGDALQALENGLVGLESATEPLAAIHELFRNAHNLKGNSGAMGYEEIVEASHALESALDGLRQGGEITVAKIGCMLGVVDILKKLVRCAVTEGDGSGAAGAAGTAGDGTGAAEGLDARPDAKSPLSIRLLGEALVLISNISDEPDQAGPVTRPASPPETGLGSPEGLSQRITSTKVDLERLDRIMDLVGELTISRIRFSALASALGSKPLLDELALSWRLTSQIQKEVMEARLIPAGQVFQRFNRLVRDVSHETEKRVKFEIAGAEIGLDRVVLESMVDPLVHLIRNAIDHGIETPPERRAAGKPEEARLALSARRERNNVALEVADDGRGIDLEKVAHAAVAAGIAKGRAADLTEDDVCRIITMAGFSTAESVDKLSGRGMGMNIVKKTVDSLGGSMHIQSAPGKGTTVTLLLPINLSIIKALLFSVGPDVHALPIEYVKETSRFEQGSLKTVRGDLVLPGADGVVPVLMPDDIFGIPFESGSDRYAKVIIVDTGTRRFAVVVNGIIGQQDIVIKALPPLFRGLRGISGATVLGSGKVAFIWDPHILFEGRCAYESDQKAVVSEN
ncbi:MAG: chemotaxis protein CheA [Candidatus Krumholzibacteria bacterium]|nr:chemotaxis protein CheA [Candidatus Krumholzibacteria bacterium]